MPTSPEVLEFQRWLRSQCADLGITQSELSHQLGITRATIRSWWLGRSRPSNQNTFKLIRAFEVLGDCEIDHNALPFRVNSCTTSANGAFGIWLLSQLNRHRISLFRLSSSTGIQEETLRQWIVGKVQPNLLNFMKVVELFCDGRPGEFLLEAYDVVLGEENERG